MLLWRPLRAHRYLGLLPLLRSRLPGLSGTPAARVHCHPRPGKWVFKLRVPMCDAGEHLSPLTRQKQVLSLKGRCAERRTPEAHPCCQVFPFPHDLCRWKGPVSCFSKDSEERLVIGPTVACLPPHGACRLPASPWPRGRSAPALVLGFSRMKLGHSRCPSRDRAA